MNQNKFEASKLALAAAVGEYIDEPDMSVNEIIYQLGADSKRVPYLTVTAEHKGKTGIQIFNEIQELAKGYKSLMEVAYNAGVNNRGFI